MFNRFSFGLGIAVATLSGVVGIGTEPASAEKPSLGVNVEGVRDWQRSLMFADAMKGARKWGSATAPWTENAVVDADGWPTTDAGVVVIADVPNINGTYHLSFTGQALVVPYATNGAIQNQVYDAGTNTTTADLWISPGATQIMLSFNNTSGGVRNVKLLRPGHTTNETFTHDFLQQIQRFDVLRVMDLTAANGNNQITWSQRTRPDYASQAAFYVGGSYNGIAWEYVIDLANTADKDIWICLPDQADVNYINQLATMLKNDLEPQRTIYVEWSNEVWNWGFPQCARNFNAATAEVNAGGSPLNADGETNANHWAWRRTAKRTKEISDQFRAIFGDSAMMTRVRPILASQMYNPDILAQGIEFLERTYGHPNQFIYAISGGAYFYLPDDLSGNPALTVNQIFAALPAAITSERQRFSVYTGWAKYFGLQNFAYESGPHLTGSTAVDAKVAANRDPRMGDMMVQHLNNWHEVGGGLNIHYNMASAYGQWGCWGLVEHITELTHKTAAVDTVNAAPKPPINIGIVPPGLIEAPQYTFRNNYNVVGNEYIRLDEGQHYNYILRVPSNGVYTLSLTVGTSGPNASLSALVNSNLVHKWTLPFTGGLAGWQPTSTVNMPLTAGLNVLRIKHNGGPQLQVRDLTINVTTTVVGDLNGDGEVGPADLGILLGSWGNPGCGGSSPCAADLNGDGAVGPADLGVLLGNWG